MPSDGTCGEGSQLVKRPRRCGPPLNKFNSCEVPCTPSYGTGNMEEMPVSQETSTLRQAGNSGDRGRGPDRKGKRKNNKRKGEGVNGEQRGRRTKSRNRKGVKTNRTTSRNRQRKRELIILWTEHVIIITHTCYPYWIHAVVTVIESCNFFHLIMVFFS